MKIKRSLKLVFFAITAIALMPSCSVYKPILPSRTEGNMGPAQIAALVKPNKVYKVLLKEGREVMITARSIDQENIYGSIKLLNLGKDIDRNILLNRNGSIRFDDISAIQQRKISPGRTVLLVCVSFLGGAYFLVKLAEELWTPPTAGII